MACMHLYSAGVQTYARDLIGLYSFDSVIGNVQNATGSQPINRTVSSDAAGGSPATIVGTSSAWPLTQVGEGCLPWNPSRRAAAAWLRCKARAHPLWSKVTCDMW